MAVCQEQFLRGRWWYGVREKDIKWSEEHFWQSFVASDLKREEWVSCNVQNAMKVT